MRSHSAGEGASRAAAGRRARRCRPSGHTAPRRQPRRGSRIAPPPCGRGRPVQASHRRRGRGSHRRRSQPGRGFARPRHRNWADRSAGCAHSQSRRPPPRWRRANHHRRRLRSNRRAFDRAARTSRRRSTGPRRRPQSPHRCEGVLPWRHGSIGVVKDWLKSRLRPPTWPTCPAEVRRIFRPSRRLPSAAAAEGRGRPARRRGRRWGCVRTPCERRG